MIKSLKLTNFKNYASAEANFKAGINFFVGLNGSGKTNLLDAVHYLCVTRSFVTPQDRFNTRHEQPFFRIEGDVSRNGDEHKVVAKVQPGSLKEIQLDGQKVPRLAEHIGFLPVVILSPKDHLLVGGASADRRKFLDFYLCQTDQEYLADLTLYNRQLAQRNALLRDRGWNAELQLLDAYTGKMAAANHRIAQKRDDFVSRLVPQVQVLYSEISDFQDEVGLQYQSDFPAHTLSDMAAQSIERDRALGRTTRGIHRDDLRFGLAHHPVKNYGSQGQMKSYLIALHLALYDYLSGQIGIPPVLLMDDIFDKLDDQRVAHLIRILSNHSYSQVFITDARARRVSDICASLNLPAHILHVAKNQISDHAGSGVSPELETFVADDQEE